MSTQPPTGSGHGIGEGKNDPAANTYVDAFLAARPRLLGAAYRILGSVEDAEDAVQDAWLSWSKADRAEVRDSTAYLLTITTRAALNRLRSQKRRREHYVGPWLPEPVSNIDLEASAELSESVSMAMMVVLESLTPVERATFVLHDVFGLTYPEVANAIGRTTDTARQIGHRARGHVEARRPRNTVSRTHHRRVTEQFVDAASTGNFRDLLSLLAPEVVLVTDGGGVRRAALHPIHGADKVARYFAGLARKNADKNIALKLLALNGEAAILVMNGEELDSVCFLTIHRNGITALHAVRNPQKLNSMPVAGLDE